MFYLIYKITNNTNGKFYIGAHKTNNKNDNYMGSGIAIKNAIKKYGKENFTKTILFECLSELEMYEKEKMLVEISSHSYNLTEGGHGGWSHILKNENYKSPFCDKNLQKMLSERGLIKLKELWEDKTFRENHSNKISEGMKGKQNFKGKSHTSDTKKLIGEKNSISQKGENNSQFGTMWITNGSKNRKINKIDKIPEGWRKGRVIK